MGVGYVCSHQTDFQINLKFKRSQASGPIENNFVVADDQQNITSHK